MGSHVPTWWDSFARPKLKFVILRIKNVASCPIILSAGWKRCRISGTRWTLYPDRQSKFISIDRVWVRCIGKFRAGEDSGLTDLTSIGYPNGISGCVISIGRRVREICGCCGEVPHATKIIGPDWIICCIVRGGFGTGFTPGGSDYCIVAWDGGNFYPDVWGSGCVPVRNFIGEFLPACGKEAKVTTGAYTIAISIKESIVSKSSNGTAKG